MNITRKFFLELLAALHNICPQAEPGDKRGKNMTETGLNAANVLFDLMEREGNGHREGVLAVVRLLAEVSCAEDQEAYAISEAERGNEGERHEDQGATIALPAMGSGGVKGSPVNTDHLTVYYEPGYVDKPYCVNVDNPDNPDCTRNPGDEGHRFATPKEAGKFIAGWLAGRHDEKEPEGTSSPRAAIVQVAIEGLVEHYPQLKRKSVVESVRKQVTIPDTGNDQADYENVRNQIEVILNKQRWKSDRIGQDV